MRLQLFRILSLVLSGLIAGTFFYGTYAVLPTFYKVPPQIHLQFRTTLMNGNRLMVMGLVLSAIASMALYYWEVRKIKVVRSFCLWAFGLTIFSLLVTRFGSVPINLFHDYGLFPQAQIGHGDERICHGNIFRVRTGIGNWRRVSVQASYRGNGANPSSR